MEGRVHRDNSMENPENRRLGSGECELLCLFTYMGVGLPMSVDACLLAGGLTAMPPLRSLESRFDAEHSGASLGHLQPSRLCVSKRTA